MSTGAEFATVRYDVDRIERELAGLRGRLDGINARFNELHRLISTEINTLRIATLNTQSDVQAVMRLAREQVEVSRDMLEQVKLSQEQQGRMLRELDELRSALKEIVK